ncbi:ribonuclease H-like domain-containing protein, partial [Tanacetum coccineum]
MVVEDDDNSRPKTVVGSSSDLNLSFGDPLYLHPNDTSGTPIVTIKLTGTENYRMWSIAMAFALRNHYKLGFIDGSCKRDSSNPGLANQWDMCNSVVVTWILNSLSSELFAGAIYAKTTSKIWNDLKETYDKVDGSAVFNLHKNINSLNLNGFTLADYYNNLNYLWKQFDAMVSLPTCTCDAAKYFDKHNQLIKNVTSVGTTKPTATAFVAQTFDNKKRFNNNFKGSGSNSNSNSNTNNKGPNPNMKCTNCNKISHTVDRCFELVGYPAGYVKRSFNSNSKLLTSNDASANIHSNGVSSNNATTSNSPVSLSSEQLTRLMNLLNENSVSTANANMAVGHPNGTKALITKISDLKINNEVLYMMYLLFDLKANMTVGIGKQYNGLYLFDVDNACKIVSNNYIASSFVSKTLWHQRLGHPADQVLDVLKTTLNLDSH